MITDGWSVALLQRELAAAYSGILAGSSPAWAPLPVQLVDYAAWQRQHLAGDALEAQLAWWAEQLAGAPPLLELPWDKPRPEAAVHAGVAAALRVEAGVAERLRELAAAERTTLFTVVLAAAQASCTRSVVAGCV